MFVPATTRSHSHQNLALSPAVPPKSTAPPHCIGSLTAAPSDHLYTPAKIVSTSSSYTSYTGGSGGPSQPTLVSQLSIASSCAAESPSPVERDGVGRSLLDGKAHNKSSGSSSVPVNSCNIVESSANSNRVSVNTSPPKHTSKSDVPYPNTSSSHYNTGFPPTSISSKKEATPTVYVDSGRPHPQPPLQQSLWQQPSHLPVTSSGGSLSISRHHHHPSKLHHRFMGSVSNPEFSVLPEVMVNPEKRTQSSSNLYDRILKPNVAPIEAQGVSPSREKLNTLSHHVYSSYDESVNHPTTSLGYLPLYTGPKAFPDSASCISSTSHPMFNIVQKIIGEMAPRLNLTAAHIQSIIDSVHSDDSSSTPRQDGNTSTSSSSSHSIIDVPTSIGIEPCAESVLKELDVDVDSQPFDTKLGVPSSGFMTLQYRARRKQLSGVHSRMKQTERWHILKVNTDFQAWVFHKDLFVRRNGELAEVCRVPKLNFRLYITCVE